MQFAVLDWNESAADGTSTATDGTSTADDDAARDHDGTPARDVVDAVRLRLDHRQFAYAGKFVRSKAGTAVAVADDTPLDSLATGGEAYADVLGAVTFDEDRTDPDVLRLRYVTVRQDRRGEGIGSRLLAFVAAAGHARGYGVVRIAVNNPFAYEAAYHAGFGWTGRETGIAELVCDHPDLTGRDPERYRAGLDLFRERGGDDPEGSFLAARVDADPPAVVEVPDGADGDDGDDGDGGE